MPVKLFNVCDECKIKIKKIRFYKTKILCNICYRKKFVIISTLGIFQERATSQVSLFLSLTPSQKKLFDERIKYLFPKEKSTRTKYLRALVLGDIENWGIIKRKEENDGERI